MKTLINLVAALVLGSGAAMAQDLIDRGMVHGWNVMVDPAYGNGCLIQAPFEENAVVRIGYDVTGNRGYLVIFDPDWGDIKDGETRNVTFDLDGDRFDAVATGLRLNRVPGAGLFFTDRNFIHDIAARKSMVVYDGAGKPVIGFSLKGTAKALEYARKCQDEMGWGG